MLRSLDDRDAGTRLKVLWIEDNIKVIRTAIRDEIADVAPYFKIWVALEPYDIKAGLLGLKETAKCALWVGDEYNNPVFPLDGYLADYNLGSSGTPTERRLDLREEVDEISGLLDYSEEIPPEEIDQLATGEMELRDLAKGAQAAGLTSAVLTALNFEGHPAVVIPYTAYPADQLTHQRAILMLLTPDSVFVQHGKEKDLAKEPIMKKLKPLAEVYRTNLVTWAEEGVVQIPYGERNRLLDLLSKRCEDSGDGRRVRWRSEDDLAVQTAYGRRQLSCASLWFHGHDAPPRYDEVSAWVERFPVPRPAFRQATELACKYFQLGVTEKSMDRYELSRLIRQLRVHNQNLAKASKKDVPSRTVARGSLTDGQVAQVEELIEVLCQQMGVNPKEALERPEDFKLLNQGWVKPHMLSRSEADDDVARLAVHMVVLLAIAGRTHRNREFIGTYQPDLQGLLDDIAEGRPPRFVSPEGKDVTGGDIDPWSNLGLMLSLIGIEKIRISEDKKKYLVPERPPLEPKDIIPYLDPLPEQLLTADEDIASGRIGVKLRRMEPSISLVDLLAGTGANISPVERCDLRAFASEIYGFPMRHWPEWLKRV